MELLSVVIPHLNQAEQLAICLASIQAQQDVSLAVEIVVADNGSPEPPAPELTGPYPVRVAVEHRPGPGPARNAGVRESNGDVLAFIDADCFAAPDWLATIISGLAQVGTAVVGGDVRVAYVDPEHPSFHEPYEAIYSYRNDEHIAEGFSGTGNLAMFRSVFEAVGPFAGIEVAEDRDWGLRAAAAGYPAKYLPGMIVYHPARDTMHDLTVKWDRHIAHDWARVSGGLGRLKWLAKSAAMGISPLAEIRTIITSPRVHGAKERLLAFACLAMIRIHRQRRMFEIAATRGRSSWAQRWNMSASPATRSARDAEAAASPALGQGAG